MYIYIYPQCKLICTWCFTWHGSRKNMGHLPASHNLPICHTSSENAQLRANTQLRIGLQMSLPIPETKHFRWLTESILNKLSLGTPRLLKHARMLFYPPWWHFGKPDGPWSWNIQRKQLLWCERKGTRFFFIPTMWEATFQKSRERQPDLDGRPEIWWMPTATSAAEFPLDMQQTASPRSNLLQENPALPGMQRCLERNKLTKQLWWERMMKRRSKQASSRFF